MAHLKEYQGQNTNSPLTALGGKIPSDNFHMLQSLLEKCCKNCIFKDLFLTQVILTKGTFGAEGMFSKCLYLFSSQHAHDGPIQPVEAIRIFFKYLATLGRQFSPAQIFFEKNAFSLLTTSSPILCLSTCLSTSQECRHSPTNNTRTEYRSPPRTGKCLPLCP